MSKAAKPNPAPAPLELLTIKDVQALLKVSHMTVYEHIRAGNLPVVRIGRAVRIRQSDLATFIDEHVTTDGKIGRAPTRVPRVRRAS